MPWGLAIAACECVQPIFADFFVCALLGTYAFGISFSGLRCVTATGATGLGARLLLSGQDLTAVRASHDGRTTPGVRRQPKPRQAQRLVGYASGRLWVDLVMDVSHFFCLYPHDQCWSTLLGLCMPIICLARRSPPSRTLAATAKFRRSLGSLGAGRYEQIWAG